MARARRRGFLQHGGAVAWPVTLVLCFGIVGLVWSLPGMRRRAERKAARCTICRRHQTRARFFVGVFMMLLVAGAVTSVYITVAPPLRCHSHVFANGQARPEPRLQNVSPPRTWNAARQVITAPMSGLALLGSWTAGMRACAGPPLTAVTFWKPPRTSGGGSAVGGTFVAWVPGGQETANALQGIRGFGIAPDGPGDGSSGRYLRYGPNIQSTRTGEQKAVRHESRHIDQWAVFTLAGGPLAFPASYYLDSAFFPFSRNHFERAAGLADGNYSIPPNHAPAPLPGAVASVGVVALLLLRRRIRWLSRILVVGSGHAADHQPGRCPRHSTGWFHHNVTNS